MMPVVMSSVLPLFLLLLPPPPGQGEQLFSLDRVIHHRLVSSLLLSLDGQHRILADLRRGIPQRIRILQSHETFFRRLFLQLLVLSALDQAIDPSLAQQVSFHFLGRSRLPARRSLIHPVYTVNALPTSGGLQLGLDFLLGSLFFEFLDPLIGALSLVEGLLFFFPYPLLIAHEHGMP